MTVYVDDFRARFRRMTMCHLAADTLDELHAFAATIGCRREWFQGDHYDVPLFRRAHAVKLGAVEVTKREGWRRVETEALADGARKRTEVLWINPAACDALDKAQVPLLARMQAKPVETGVTA